MENVVVVLLAVASVGAVLYPLIRREAAAPDPILVVRPDDPPPTRKEVDRYRAALRRGTLCRGCGLANPEGSRFCAECGHRLESAPRDTARRRPST
jgi:hypothetical protein